MARAMSASSSSPWRLAQAWLCEQTALPLAERPCGTCAACRLVAARSHPDLLVLLPDALRETLGWGGDAGEGDEEREASKKKPSKEIRIEAIRAAIAFATTTSARGRGKVVVVHPAERMNPAAANAFLKTLEEPAGDSRFLLCSAAPDALAPTIRSRCQDIALAGAGRAPRPRPGSPSAASMHPGCCSPAAAADRRRRSTGPRTASTRPPGARLPGRIAARRCSARFAAGRCRGSSTRCRSSATTPLALACGAEPRYFPRASLGKGAEIAALLDWNRELTRLATDVEHPWSVDLALESLVEQSREALKTPRSGGHEGQGLSVNSAPMSTTAARAALRSGLSVPAPAATRPSVIQLVFRERGALYAAYMPMFSEGGIFVPTTRDYKLGEDIYLLLSLPDDPQRYPVAGKVGWITPANASGGRTQGVGVRFPTDEKSRALRARIEEALGTSISSVKPTQTI